MLDELRNLARRSERLRAAAGSARQGRCRITDAASLADYCRGRATFSALADPVAIRTPTTCCSTEADQHGVDAFVRWLEGPMTTREMVATILGSDEFALPAFRALSPSPHFSRGAFVRALPPPAASSTWADRAPTPQAGPSCPLAAPTPSRSL